MWRHFISWFERKKEDLDRIFLQTSTSKSVPSSWQPENSQTLHEREEGAIFSLDQVKRGLKTLKSNIKGIFDKWEKSGCGGEDNIPSFINGHNKFITLFYVFLYRQNKIWGSNSSAFQNSEALEDGDLLDRFSVSNNKMEEEEVEDNEEEEEEKDSEEVEEEDNEEEEEEDSEEVEEEDNKEEKDEIWTMQMLLQKERELDLQDMEAYGEDSDPFADMKSSDDEEESSVDSPPITKKRKRKPAKKQKRKRKRKIVPKLSWSSLESDSDSSSTSDISSTYKRGRKEVSQQDVMSSMVEANKQAALYFKSLRK